MTTTNAAKLRDELTAWANGDLSQTAPTQLADSPDYQLLGDAIDFELGNYTCEDSEQREKALAAITRFCAETEDYD